MPTYQYRCTECGSALEAQQAFTDDPLTVCPSCRGRLRKVFSPVGIVFKGSGFYRNDSRAKTATDAAPKEPKEPKERKEPKEPKDGAGTSKELAQAAGSGDASGGSSPTSTGTSKGTTPGKSTGTSSAAAAS